jgi:hypothetical protein
LCADGFIIRAQAMIRTDEFFVRAAFANTGTAQVTAKACALRAPTTSKLYGWCPSVQFGRGFSGKPPQNLFFTMRAQRFSIGT